MQVSRTQLIVGSDVEMYDVM